MNDLETVKLIIFKQKGDAFQLDVHNKDSVGTRTTAKRLIQLIVTKRQLPEAEYELYVKVPQDKSLGALGIDKLESLLLVPVPGELEDAYIPGSQ